MEPKIVVQNVVASARLEHGIDVEAIVKAFPGLVFRLKRSRSSVLIFRNRKMVCTGAKSEREATGGLQTKQ